MKKYSVMETAIYWGAHGIEGTALSDTLLETNALDEALNLFYDRKRQHRQEIDMYDEGTCVEVVKNICEDGELVEIKSVIGHTGKGKL